MDFNKSMVTVNVRGDYGECFDFYTKKLGLIPTWGDRNGPWTGFATKAGDDYSFAIFKAEGQAAYKGYNLPSANSQPDTTSLGIPCENIEEDYKRLKEAGVEFIGELQTVADWGVKCAYFRDTEGNLLSLTGDI
ncbi:MAG: VOC family protein [Defluviitaleaceae bacterium]|nr:VOC family protein [Defluviitaleaceae bacterium]